MRTILTLLVVFLFLGNKTFSQDETMKVWMEYMTPGKGHEMLAKGAGEWKSVIKFWMAPGTEPQVSEGYAISEMILGGRYLQSKHSGSSFGMPLEGISVEGFDNAKGTFFSTWIDNMGTGIMYLEGKYDDKTKTCLYEGTVFDPMTKKNTGVREVVKHLSDDHQIMEMYMVEPDGEFKSMEIEFTRKK
jgi:hypothetical protein